MEVKMTNTDLNEIYRKPFLTVKEVAKVLGFDITTVYALLKRGELVGIKLRPKAWRIKKEDLEAYLVSKKVKNDGQKDNN